MGEGPTSGFNGSIFTGVPMPTGFDATEWGNMSMPQRQAVDIGDLIFGATPPTQSPAPAAPAPLPQQQPPAQLVRSGDPTRPPGMFGMGAPGGYTPQMSTLTGPNPLTLANSLLPKPNIQPGPIPGQPTTV